MRAAVTGAAGFVGSNLLTRLAADGHDVLAIDRSVGTITPQERVTRVEADILDPASLAGVLDGVDVVFHLVAAITLKQEDPAAWRVNTEGVAAVAQAALRAGVPRFVHCSSVHSFDEHACGGYLDETSLRSHEGSGLPVYDRSKYAGEQALHAVIAQGLDAVICNPTGVYGPVDDPQRLSRLNGMVRDAARGRVPVSVGGGFDLVDVRDVVDGLVLAAEHGRTGENYILGGELLRLHDLMARAARAAGKRGPLFAIPLGLVRLILPIVEPIGLRFDWDVLTRAALSAAIASPEVDSSKAESSLGYRARPAHDTIRDTVAQVLTPGAPVSPELT